MEGTFADPGFGLLTCLGLFCPHRYSIKSEQCLPCNGSDLRDLPGIQERICGTAEGSSDIERDDEFSLGASIPGASYIHDKEQTLAASWTWSYFPFIKAEGKKRRHGSQPHIEVDPINNEETSPNAYHN